MDRSSTNSDTDCNCKVKISLHRSRVNNSIDLSEQNGTNANIAVLYQIIYLL